MTRGIVTLALRHVRCLVVQRREARDRLREVRAELREHGLTGLADQVSGALDVLGRMGLVLRAAESAAERGQTMDDELRRLAVQGRNREVA